MSTTVLSCPLWPSSVWRQSPLLASQIFTVRSSDADASRVESGEKATELTARLWPSSVWRQSPLLASQICTVGYHVDASLVEYGVTSTVLPQPMCAEVV